MEGKKVELLTDFIFLGSKITADGDCSHKFKRYLLLGRKTMTNHQFIQLLSRAQLFVIPWTAACQDSLSITNSHSLLRLMSIKSVMPSIHLISSCPLLLPPSIFLASGSFQMSQLFASVGPSIGVSVSTSVLPVNIQDWFPLEWTVWISLQSKGLSRVISNTTVQKHQFLGTQLSL